MTAFAFCAAAAKAAPVDGDACQLAAETLGTAAACCHAAAAGTTAATTGLIVPGCCQVCLQAIVRKADQKVLARLTKIGSALTLALHAFL
mmetsp:Transcript_27671/g.44372  ORF Transcript_27671/g.44372 Transcript_27671/m.44372 type:complete len:90 (+) Transcript_27671:2368-2637(+)